MTSEGSGEMFECDFEYMCANKFLLSLMEAPLASAKIPDIAGCSIKIVSVSFIQIFLQCATKTETEYPIILLVLFSGTFFLSSTEAFLSSTFLSVTFLSVTEALLSLTEAFSLLIKLQ